MKRKLADYGLSVDMASSALLDAVENSTGDYVNIHAYFLWFMMQFFFEI